MNAKIPFEVALNSVSLSYVCPGKNNFVSMYINEKRNIYEYTKFIYVYSI